MRVFYQPPIVPIASFTFVSSSLPGWSCHQPSSLGVFVRLVPLMVSLSSILVPPSSASSCLCGGSGSGFWLYTCQQVCIWLGRPCRTASGSAASSSTCAPRPWDSEGATCRGSASATATSRDTPPCTMPADAWPSSRRTHSRRQMARVARTHHGCMNHRLVWCGLNILEHLLFYISPVLFTSMFNLPVFTMSLLPVFKVCWPLFR